MTQKLITTWLRILEEIEKAAEKKAQQESSLPQNEVLKHESSTDATL